MKKSLILGLGALVALASCSKDEESNLAAGYLVVNTSLNSNVNLKTLVNNPNDFKLTISKKSDGTEVKSFNKVSDAGTAPIELAPDTYIVKTSSNNFTTSDWETPLYQATQEVTIASNSTTTATLVNTQANAGVKVVYTDAFKAKYSAYQTVIESATGNLTYAQAETRTGYFTPGSISIKVTGGTTVFDAITRTVNAKELVTVKVDYSATGNINGKVTLSITVDNTVTERTEDIVISDGGGNTGETGVASLEETFDAAATGNFALQGWTTAYINGNDIVWKIAAATAPSTNKYVELNTYKSGGTSSYENWLISPALDITAAQYKNLDFETAKGFFNAASTLEVYILDKPDVTTATKTKLAATIAASTDVDGIFIKSGNVNLSSYSGVKYIAFKYVGTNTASTRFWVDNFRFGLTPVVTPPPATGHGTVATDPFSVAEAISTQDNSVKWVQGYIVGFAASAGTSGGFTIKSSGIANTENTNLVLAPSATETDPSKCVAVALPTGTVRDALNVYTNPSNIGKQVVVKGQLVAYFSRPGIKSVADYQFK